MTHLDATENPAAGHALKPATRPCGRSRRPAAGERASARTVLATLAALSALWLTACGGGGSDGSPAGDTPTGGAPTTPTPSPTQTAAGEAVAPLGEANCGLVDMQTQITARLSAVRAQTLSCGSMGTYPAVTQALRWNALLYEAARVHSLDMADLAYFEHDGPQGDTPQSRVTAAGYAYATVAENLARGRNGLSGKALDVEAVIELWKRSPPHCANLMARRAVDVGLACVVNRSGVRYWTLVLASPLS